MALIPRRRQDVADQDFLDSAADMGAERLAAYTLHESYYDGEHNTELTDRAAAYLEISNVTFRENFCETVIDSLAERLEVTGFTSDDAAAADLADGWWTRNRMDARQGEIYTATLTLGDGFVICDWPDEYPRFSFNRPQGIKPAYSSDSPDELEYVAKRWVTKAAHPRLNPKRQELERLNLYYPNRVEKHYRVHAGGARGGWTAWQDVGPAGEEPWPLPWTTRAGEPLGIPVFHLRNKPIGRTYGRSELINMVPQQDALNKMIVDLMMVLDQMGLPQDWATGVPQDNADLTRALDIWVATSAEAKFGRLPPTNPEGMLTSIDKQLERIAKRSRTPMHLITGGDMPSGEALKSAEAGLVTKARALQAGWGDVWEQAMRLAFRLAVDRGPDVPDDPAFVAEWRDPESRSDKDEAERLVLLRDAGLVSRRTAMAQLGYDPDAELIALGEETDTLADAAGRLLDEGAAADMPLRKPGGVRGSGVAHPGMPGMM